MADNFAFTPGAGATGAADDIGGILYPRVKLTVGADGVATDASAGAGAVGTGVQRTTLASDDPAVTALQIIDDWDETDRAKVNPIVGVAGVAAGAGAVSTSVQRTTLASDDPAVTALQIMDDWDETNRAAVNTIAGQVGVAGGTGAVGATVQRVTIATDDAFITDITAIKTAVQIMDDWDSTDAMKAVGILDNPTSVYTRPADTTAYAANDIVSNNTTAGSITVQSFTAARVAAGSGLIRRLRLVSNHTTGLSAVQFSIRLWTAAPTYTNGDNGAYAVATGGAGYIGTFLATFEQFADAAVAIGSPSVGAEVAFKLASGQVIYWDMQTLTLFTPQSAKTFTLTAEVIQD